MTTKTTILSVGVLPFIALFLLFGCAHGAQMASSSPTNPPENFRFDTVHATNSIADLPWRDVFQDPVLQDLITVALTNNYDLRQAVARVEEARYVAMAARSPLYPQVSYGGDVGRGRNSLYNAPATLGGATESSALAALNATWEIDLWGRIRRLSQAAEAQYLCDRSSAARCDHHTHQRSVR